MRRAETGVADRERDHMRFIFASLLLLTAILCPAQEFRSTLSGIVTDSQGAVIAGAKLAAKQKETGAEFQTVSGQDGQ